MDAVNKAKLPVLVSSCEMLPIFAPDWFLYAEFLRLDWTAKLSMLQDSFGHKREIVLMSIASEYAFQKMFDIFLTSLQNITFPRKDG